jgi:hypothetical protein
VAIRYLGDSEVGIDCECGVLWWGPAGVLWWGPAGVLWWDPAGVLWWGPAGVLWWGPAGVAAEQGCVVGCWVPGLHGPGQVGSEG